MKSTINCNWKDGMAFEAEVNGFKLTLDADAAVGGENKGPRPKPLTLVALAGCTAMDVISILKKMRVELKSLNVIVEGELSEEHPRHFTKMHVIYEVEGENIPMDKIEKAVSLSEEKYCGVSAFYREVIDITSEIRIKSQG